MMIKKTSGSQKAKKNYLLRWKMTFPLPQLSVFSFLYEFPEEKKKTASILIPKVDLSHQEQKDLAIIARYLASKICWFSSLFCFQE